MEYISKKSVIIIGAGISGLAAANYLNHQNINVKLLEAQNRVGGRIKTEMVGGLAFDYGASWIHGPNGDNPITSLAKKADVNTFWTNEDSIKVYDKNGKPIDYTKVDKAYTKYLKVLDNLSGNVNDSFEKVFFDKYPECQDSLLWKYQLSAYLEFDLGGDISHLSSLDFNEDHVFPGEDILVTNGYDKITDYLKRELDIQLNSKVKSINYRDDKIIVIAEEEVFEADYVIVTVPLGVLKKNIIEFTPTLPEEKEWAIEKIQMGAVNKFICVWEKSFWDKEVQFLGFTPEIKGKFNFFVNFKRFGDINALMTFTFGEYAKESESLSDQEIIKEIMNHLKIMYGNSIPNPISMKRTQWFSDENTYGSYSFPTNGSRTTAFDILSKSVNNKLFFAGEHTDRYQKASVHGAYLSGERAAKEIVEVLNK